MCPYKITSRRWWQRGKLKSILLNLTATSLRDDSRHFHTMIISMDYLITYWLLDLDVLYFLSTDRYWNIRSTKIQPRDNWTVSILSKISMTYPSTPLLWLRAIVLYSYSMKRSLLRCRIYRNTDQLMYDTETRIWRCLPTLCFAPKIRWTRGIVN